MTTPTLLATVQRVYRRLAFQPITVVAASTALQDQQAFEICNDVGTDLMRNYRWPFLRKVGTITTGIGTSIYTVTSGAGGTEYTCDRIIADTQYDVTNQWRFVGSVDDQTWYAYQYDVMTQPIRRIWRVASKTTIEVFPTPTVAGETLAVPFISDKWAQNSGGTTYTAAFVADADTHRFDYDLFDLGVRVRFMELKGLDYAKVLDEYNAELERRIAAFSNPGTLSLARGRRHRLLSNDNVPNTGYGV